MTVDGKTYTYYDATQEQRRREREIRALKREESALTAAGLDELAKQKRSLIEQKAAEYEDFSRDVGIRAKNERLRVCEVGNSSLTPGGESGTIPLDDIPIPLSVGAKGINYDILSPDGERYFHYVEGTYVQRVKVFAGYGTKTPLDEGVPEGLTEEFGGSPDKWKHVKGEGVIDDDGEEVRAEVHWFQEESVGQVKHMIKKWLE